MPPVDTGPVVQVEPEHWWERWTRRRDDLAAGDRVLITALGVKGRTGSLVRRTRLVNGKTAWLVAFDQPLSRWVWPFAHMRVAEWSLAKLDHDR
jgi:hypothetical protein